MLRLKPIRDLSVIKSLYSNLHRISSSVWTYPVILSLIICCLAIFQVHGSSIGIYHQALQGKTSSDPNLIYGSPQPVRSDEWLGWTQFSFAQGSSNFPTDNELLGSGRDLSKQPELPVKNWINIFRPPNWSFFVLPLENAYAFKWWSLLLVLAVSSYFFVLRIIPKQKSLAIILSLAFSASPYLLWWYQSALFLSMAFGFLILLLGFRIVDRDKIRFVKSKILSSFVYVNLLAFLGACLALTLYPPFFLPVIIAVTLILAAYLLESIQTNKLRFRDVSLIFAQFCLALILVAIIMVLFIDQHQEMIKATTNTVYPGLRRSSSGGLPVLAMFDGFLMPLLQGSFRGMNFYTNQSEASNFILLLPFLVIPSFFLICREYFRERKIDFVFLAINSCIVLFLLRALVHQGDILYRLLLLDRVPSVRLVAVFGFLGFIQLVYFIKKVDSSGIRRRGLVIIAGIYSLICFSALMIVGENVINQYPKFLNNYYLMIALATLFILILFCFLSNLRFFGALLLLFFTLFSSYRIMPLYRGLDFFEQSPVFKKIQEVSQKNDSWITTDDIYYSNFPLIAGRNLISGSQVYPDLGFWRQIGNGKYEEIYNRQARSVFITTNPKMPEMELAAPNFFKIRFDCSSFVTEKVDYILAVYPIEQPCVQKIDEVNYPHQSFYIYKVNSKYN